MTVTDRCHLYLLNTYDVKGGEAISHCTYDVFDGVEDCLRSDCCTQNKVLKCSGRLLGLPVCLCSCVQTPVSTVAIVAEGTLKGLANVFCLPITSSEHRWERCKIALETFGWADLYVPTNFLFEFFLWGTMRSTIGLMEFCEDGHYIDLDNFKPPDREGERFRRNLLWRRGVVTAPPTGRSRTITTPPQPTPGMINSDTSQTYNQF